MSDRDYADEYGEQVVKYARPKLRHEQIHPELQFTRLGALLREHATDDTPGNVVGNLSHQLLTQPADQPLDVTPLHLLRDYLLENPSHSLGTSLRWQSLPEKVLLDQTTHELTRGNETVLSGIRSGNSTASTYNTIRQIRDPHSWASVPDVQQSAARVGFRRVRQRLHDEGRLQHIFGSDFHDLAASGNGWMSSPAEIHPEMY